MTLNRPPTWSLDELRQRASGSVVLWATPSVRERLSSELPWKVSNAPTPLPPGVDWLVAAGGGLLMDLAKSVRLSQPGLKLALIPTIWGSGAEASPIIVLSHAGEKEITVDPRALPDAVVYLTELARTVSPQRQRDACADCWAHALEGFLSPLSTPELRKTLARILRRLLALPWGYHPDWFQVSAAACAAQAQASVGLVHGIAHSLEAPLLRQQPQVGWHHALLCSAFLYPTMCLNRESSPRVVELIQEEQLEVDPIWQTLRALWPEQVFRAVAPTLAREWPRALRNPCTRTNCALVRPDWLSRLQRFVVS